MQGSVNITCPSCLAVNRVPKERLNQGPKCGRCHKPILAGHPLELNSGNFQKHLIKTQIPTAVLFWAPWCSACQSMMPHFGQAAPLLAPHIRLARLNSEAEQAIAARYNVMSLPSLLLFENGREKARLPGALTNAQQIAAWVRQNL